MKALKLILAFLVISILSCKKDTPIDPESKTSESYLRAHDFYNSGKIEIKEHFIPTYNPNLPYEKWEFYELPSPSKGYIYKSLVDTPWLVPTFISFEVDYDTPQDSVTQKAFDKSYSYFVYDVKGFFIINGSKYEIKSYHAKYLKHKTNNEMPDLFNYAALRDPTQINTPRMFGLVDKIAKKIVFEAYFIDKPSLSVSSKFQIESLLQYGYKEPGDVKLLKKIDSIVFNFYER
jgi:hypothetical protein